jgi:hypothetical protein
MQTRVRQRFSQLQSQDDREGKVPWYVINAAATIDEVQGDINEVVQKTIDKVQKENQPLHVLWQTEDKSDDKEN